MVVVSFNLIWRLQQTSAMLQNVLKDQLHGKHLDEFRASFFVVVVPQDTLFSKSKIYQVSQYIQKEHVEISW